MQSAQEKRVCVVHLQIMKSLNFRNFTPAQNIIHIILVAPPLGFRVFRIQPD